jgi:RHS repeat-associated protein
MMRSEICASDVCFVPSSFTGKERDAESGLDYFGARYYASSMGRLVNHQEIMQGSTPTPVRAIAVDSSQAVA